MEVYLSIFIFLAALATKTTEACQNKEDDGKGNKMYFQLDELNPPITIVGNILIAGAGAQMVALLAEFAEMKPKKTFHIIIVEKKSKLAPGTPYDDDIQNDEHLLNVHSASGIATSSHPHDFSYWLLFHPGLYTLSPSKRMAAPPRRTVFGKYLIQRFREFVKKCGKRGYKISTIPNASAANITKDGADRFAVTLSNEVTVRADDVFLATGHFDWSRFGDQDIKGYYKSPWPASVLTDLEKGIPGNEDVGILGSGLSAIDAVLTLACKYGEFKSLKKGFLYITSYKFNITMYSRSGHLPAVTSIIDAKVKLRYLDQNEINKVRGKNGGFLPLDDIFQMLKDEVKATLYPPFSRVNAYSRMGYTRYFKKLDVDTYSEKTPIERLAKDIDQATKPSASYTLFQKVHLIFNTYARFFLAEDAIAFKKYFVPWLLKMAVTMPLDTAEKLLALMNAGHLRVVAVGDDSNVTASGDNVGVWLQYKTVNKYHRYFIDAIGQSGDMDKDPKSLTRSLLKNNLARKLCIPYKNHVKAKEAYDEQEDENGDIQPLGNEKYCHRSDGVEVDIDSMRVIPPGETYQSIALKPSAPAIYASGPFAYGRAPFAQALPVVSTFAKTAAGDIKKRRFVMT